MGRFWFSGRSLLWLIILILKKMDSGMRCGLRGYDFLDGGSDELTASIDMFKKNLEINCKDCAGEIG